MQERQAVTLLAPTGEPVKDIALQHIAIRGKISGLIGHFTIQHTFKHIGKDPLEIIYTFPLNSRAIIEGFIAKLGERFLTSELMKSTEAEKKYEEAVLEGDSAVMLEMHRSNVSTLSVGNLAPGEDLVVQIKFLLPLEVKGDRVKVIFPTVVGPRYIPGEPVGNRTGFGWADPTDAVPDADWITPPVDVNGVPYRVSMEISVDDPDFVRSVESPSHPIRVTKDDGRLLVALTLNEKADRDIVLNFQVDEEKLNRTIKVANLGDKKVAQMFISDGGERTSQRTEPADFIFLLDRSGSMSGEKLREAKKALRLCLRKLRSGDRFTIFAFDHTLTIFDRLVPFNRLNLHQADLWIQQIEAGGGTELFEALRVAFLLESSPNRERVLVLITDGQVGDEERIARLFEENRRNLKVLLIGIDTAVNQELFERILLSVPGWVEYIYPGEPLEEAVSLQFQRLLAPTVKEVEFNSEGIEVKGIYPPPPFLLKQHGATGILVEFEGDLKDEVEYLLKLSDGRLKSESRSVEVLDGEDAKLIGKLWAREGIRVLETKLLSVKREGRARVKEIEEAITKIALEYKLQSAFTRWVAVLRRKDKIEGIPKVQVVPQEFPYKWETRVLCKVSHELNVFDPFSRLFSFFRRKDVPAQKSEELLSSLLLQQDWDGSFRGGDSLDEVRNTLISLAILVFFARAQRLELTPYQSNIEKALDYLSKNWDGCLLEEVALLYMSLRSLGSLLPGIVAYHAFNELRERIEQFEEELMRRRKTLGKLESSLVKLLREKRQEEDIPRLTNEILNRMRRFEKGG
jgi:Ca-activated chloride channel family protein